MQNHLSEVVQEKKMKKSNLLISVLLGIIMALGGCASPDNVQTSTDVASNENADGVYDVATVRWADRGEDYHTGFPDLAARDKGITINLIVYSSLENDSESPTLRQTFPSFFSPLSFHLIKP